MTKLGPKLPDDHGLSAIARALVDRPHEPHAEIRDKDE